MLRLVIDAERPNPRQLQRIVDIVAEGGVVVYPTDTGYGLGCDILQKKSVEKIYAMKGKDRRHPLAFICADLKEISRFAIVSNAAYRTMKRILPGAYTLILPASREVPRLMLSKQATVGIRIPDHKAALMLVELLGHPLVSTSVPVFDDESGFVDPQDLVHCLSQVDAIVDCGLISPEPSTIIDFSTGAPILIREGKGEFSFE